MLRNQTLANMHPDDLGRLVPFMTEVAAQRGEVLISQGADIEQMYFPTTAYLANTIRFADGSSALTFVMGSEGVSGLAGFLAERPSALTVEVRSPGSMYRLPAAILRGQMAHSPRLQRQLLELAYDYQAEAAYGVGCAARHTARTRVATLILRSAERLGTSKLLLTQQDLSDFLGMQRTTANAAAKYLRTIGAVRYSRAVIEVVDRDALMAHSCECYAATRRVNEAMTAVGFGTDAPSPGA